MSKCPLQPVRDTKVSFSTSFKVKYSVYPNMLSIHSKIQKVFPLEMTKHESSQGPSYLSDFKKLDTDQKTIKFPPFPFIHYEQ